MDFPATLPPVTCTGQLNVLSGPPIGATFIIPKWLYGPDGDIVAPYREEADIASDGTFSIQLPPTNHPDWVPVDWTIYVRLHYGNRTETGVLQVPYDGGDFFLADRFNPDGAEQAGTTYLPLSLRGAANGVASLDGTTHVPISQIPDLAIAKITSLQGILDGKQPTGAYLVAADIATKADLVGGVVPQSQIPAIALVQYLGTAANQAAMLAKVGQAGDWVNRTDLGTAWQITGSDPTQLAHWTELLTPTSPVQSVAGKTGAVTLVKADVGLSNIDDTSDASKPISTAQAIVNAATFRATDHGLVGWSFDPAYQQGQFVLPTSGVSHVVRVRALSSVVTGIRFHLVQPGSGLTSGQCFASLHNAAGAQLGLGAITGDLSVIWATGGDRLCPLNVAQGVTPGADYLVRFWFNGTTGPSLSRAGSSSETAINWGMSAPTFRYSTADTGLTTTGPSNIGTQTAAGVALLVGLY